MHFTEAISGSYRQTSLSHTHTHSLSLETWLTDKHTHVRAVISRPDKNCSSCCPSVRLSLIVCLSPFVCLIAFSVESKEVLSVCHCTQFPLVFWKLLLQKKWTEFTLEKAGWTNKQIKIQNVMKYVEQLFLTGVPLHTRVSQKGAGVPPNLELLLF